MDQETYERYKQTLTEGKIVHVGGRTAATTEQLDALRRADGQTAFGSQPGKTPGEVMAIDSGRLSPAEIEALGPKHPLIVAAQRLTASQLDALVSYVTEPLLDELKAKDSGEEPPRPAEETDMTLSDDPSKQGVQAQMATGATDNVSPKTVLDNKTDATVPAGKNASRTAADAAQDQEKTAAKTAS